MVHCPCLRTSNLHWLVPVLFISFVDPQTSALSPGKSPPLPDRLIRYQCTAFSIDSDIPCVYWCSLGLRGSGIRKSQPGVNRVEERARCPLEKPRPLRAHRWLWGFPHWRTAGLRPPRQMTAQPEGKKREASSHRVTSPPPFLRERHKPEWLTPDKSQGKEGPVPSRKKTSKTLLLALAS